MIQISENLLVTADVIRKVLHERGVTSIEFLGGEHPIAVQDDDRIVFDSIKHATSALGRLGVK